MHPRIAKLYLEFMLLAPALTTQTYSASFSSTLNTKLNSVTFTEALTSTSSYRAKVQEGFMKPPQVTPGTKEFARRLARGRWALRQLKDLIIVKKYRAMHKRYGWASFKSSEELVEWFGEEKAKDMMIGLGNKEIFGFSETTEDKDKNDERK